MSQIFTIGAGGLKPIGGQQLAVYAGAKYHYGHSSTPDSILVDSVDGDRVYFRQYPFTKSRPQSERLDMFRHTAEVGTRTKLACLRRLVEHSVPWITRLTEHYEKVLAGEVGDKWSRDDERMVVVEFAYTGDGDGWSEFEEYYPHSVNGSQVVNGRTVYDSYDFNNADADTLRRRIEAAEMPGFVFVGKRDR